MTHDTSAPATAVPRRPSRPGRASCRRSPLLAVVAFLLGGIGGSFEGKLSDVQKNDNSAFLPSSAESTKVANESDKFITVQNIPGFLVYQRAGGLTAERQGQGRGRPGQDRRSSPASTRTQLGQPQVLPGRHAPPPCPSRSSPRAAGPT